MRITLAFFFKKRFPSRRGINETEGLVIHPLVFLLVER